MAGKQSIMQRWTDYQASKTLVFWCCAGCVVATMVVGFSWGGWVTGGTASAIATKAAATARADLMAAICVTRFDEGPDVAVRLASLKGTESWKRDEFIVKGGWANVAGQDKPVEGAAGLCAQKLIDAKLPAGKPAGTSG
jgi:hypothetical protein